MAVLWIKGAFKGDCLVVRLPNIAFRGSVSVDAASSLSPARVKTGNHLYCSTRASSTSGVITVGQKKGLNCTVRGPFNEDTAKKAAASSICRKVLRFASLRRFGRNFAPSYWYNKVMRMEKEDKFLFGISATWALIFTGAAVFQSWRSSTVPSRHPYITNAIDLIQGSEPIIEYLGGDFNLSVIKEVTETFAPWKRLRLRLKGKDGRTGTAYVTATHIGYSDDELMEQDEDEDVSVFAKPYLLKRRVIQFLLECWELVQHSTRNGGYTEQNSIPRNSEVSLEGGWQITSLFIVLDEHSEKAVEGPKVDRSYKGEELSFTAIREYSEGFLKNVFSKFRQATSSAPQAKKNIVVVKGNPEDNPDWYCIMPNEKQQPTPLTAPVLILTCLSLFAFKRLHVEWIGAKQRLACLRYIRNFIQANSHLHQLAARQAAAAVAAAQPNRFHAVYGGTTHFPVNIHLRYFTGELSPLRIDGVCHLEIEPQGVDTTCMDDVNHLLQGELKVQAWRATTAMAFKAYEANLSIIENKGEDGPPFPVVSVYPVRLEN